MPEATTLRGEDSRSALFSVGMHETGASIRESNPVRSHLRGVTL
jgi:hypothetical protein